MIRIPYPQIINELSFVEQRDRTLFLEKIKAFLKVIDEMHSIGFQYRFAFVGSLKEKSCFPGMNLKKWLFSKDGSADEQDIKKRLRPLFTNGALIENLMSPDCGKEVFYNDREIGLSGMLASYVFSLPSISMQAEEFLDQCCFSLDIYDLDSEGEIIKCNEKVTSISQTVHIKQIADENMLKMLKEISSGKDVLTVADEMLSYLDFSKKAKDQLEKLNASSYIYNGFSWICFTLLKLNHVMHLALQNANKTFCECAIETSAMNMSDESISTKRKYKGTRTFEWDDGTLRDCWLHVKNIGSNIRIHVYPDPIVRKLYIGYIGGHLPTIKFPH
ncbi:MAG: hypothetical protein IJJ26_07250 [Victivallales bacterium]|nr:hypothetical protein [Victivallales bacterium]